MLLETLDIKENDIIIYSQNIPNLEKNFRIIFKDKPDKKAYKISYSEVCRQINEFAPKNLIVYRLLTNKRNLTLDNVKYGFLIYINGIRELIYFDPIFAVKELEGLFNEGDLPNIRFRIQQVGLTTLSRKNNFQNYAEIYSIDLEATEAKFQNDKVFADALFNFTIDNDFRKEPIKTVKKPEKILEKIYNKKVKNILVVNKGVKIISHNIAEDKNYDFHQVKKMNYGRTLTKEIVNDEGKNIRISTSEDEVQPDVTIPSAITSEENGAKSLNDFIKSKKPKTKTGEEALEKSLKAQVHLLDIFKSSESLKKYMLDKEDKRVVLKLK
ncbi:MAG: hypothetical protein IIA48_10655 [Bacteroidetes bacterium]|nr:hypothetical protein [Bacteroidota bacterium]